MARLRLGDATPDTPTGNDTPVSAGGGWLNTIQQAIPTLIQARYQDKLLSENFKRAQAGLPPLNADQFKPGVQVGLDTGTRSLIGWGIGGLLALGLVLGMSRRRAR